MKKYIYILAWVVLGLLLSFIAHAIIEINYINYSLAKGVTLKNYTAFGPGYCILPVWLQVGLIILGILGGFLAGRFFWRVIYIQSKRIKLK